MKKLLLIFFCGVVTICCSAQKQDSNLQWKTFNFPEAGMKASFPCEPEKYFKSFQDKPRPIHVYDFDCEVEGIKFLISSKHYMDDFNENTFNEIFENHEFILKKMFGEIESYNEKKDFFTNGFASRFYEAKYKSGGDVNSLVVLSENRSYEAMIGNPSVSVKNPDFNEISTKFIDSFQITDK